MSKDWGQNESANVGENNVGGEIKEEDN